MACRHVRAFWARAVRDAVEVRRLELSEVFCGLREVHLAQVVRVHRLGPVLAATERTKGGVDHTPVEVAHEGLRDAIESALLAHKHDSVAVGVKVVLELTGGASRHEKKAVILEVHLAPVWEAAAPVAHVVVLEQAGADDIMGRLCDAHGALEHASRDGAAAERKEGFDVTHVLRLHPACVDAAHGEVARSNGTLDHAVNRTYNVAPRAGVPHHRRRRVLGTEDSDELVLGDEVDVGDVVHALGHGVRALNVETNVPLPSAPVGDIGQQTPLLQCRQRGVG